MSSYDQHSGYLAQQGAMWAEEFLEERPEYKELLEAHANMFEELFGIEEFDEGNVGDWVFDSVRARFASALEVAEQWAYDGPSPLLPAESPTASVRKLLDALDLLREDHDLNANHLAALLVVAGHSMDVDSGEPFLRAFLSSVGQKLDDAAPGDDDPIQSKFKLAGEPVAASRLPDSTPEAHGPQVRAVFRELDDLVDLYWNEDTNDVVSVCEDLFSDVGALAEAMDSHALDTVEQAELIFLVQTHLAATCAAEATNSMTWHDFLCDAVAERSHLGDWLLASSRLSASVKPWVVLSREQKGKGWMMLEEVTVTDLIDAILCHEHCRPAVRSLVEFFWKNGEGRVGLARKLAEAAAPNADVGDNEFMWLDRLDNWAHAFR